MMKLNVLAIGNELTQVEDTKAFYKAVEGEFAVLNKTHVQTMLEAVKKEVRQVRKDSGKRISQEAINTLLANKEALNCLPPVYLSTYECKPYFLNEMTTFECLIVEAEMNGVNVYSKTELIQFVLTTKQADSIVISDELGTQLYMTEQPYGIRVFAARGTIIRLNDKGQINHIKQATTQFEKLYRTCLERASKEDKGRTKRDQFSISQVHVNGLKETMVNGKIAYETKPGAVIEDVKNSSSLMLEMATAKGYKIITLSMNISVKSGDTDGEEGRVRLVSNVINNGFVHNNELYRPLLQTASQSRTGKVYMINLPTDELVEEFRHELSFGAFKEKYEAQGLCILAKDEARFGLAGTSAIGVGFFGKCNDTKETVTDDCKEPVNFKAIELDYTYDDKGNVAGYKFKNTLVKENMSTDGCSFGCPTWFAHVSARLGAISNNQLVYFLENYTTLAELKHSTDKKLMKIFKAMHKVVQVRRGNTKGLIMMWDVKQYPEYKELDVVLTDGMVKAYNKEAAEWRIANVNNKVWGKQRLSQQFMTNLNMNADHVTEMVNEQLSYISERVMKDANEARKFVGAIAGIQDLDTVDVDGEETPVISTSTKLAAALSANSVALRDSWIQSKLYDLMRKEIMNLKYGKLLVDGIYAYNLPDPRDIFEPENALKAGQFYLNNMTQEVVLLRAPNIHRSEVHTVQLVEDDTLWFLENAIVFNRFDDVAQASQGADFDGDQFLITDNKYVLQAAKNNGDLGWMVVQGVPTNGDLKVPYSITERLNLYITRSTRDNVGVLSNYALIFGDMRNHWLACSKEATTEKEKAYYLTNAKECDIKVAILACLIGAEIDYAKTGVKGVLLDNIIPKDLPEFFMHYKGEFKETFDYNPIQLEAQKAKVESKGGKVYVSKSALGVCFKVVSAWDEQMKQSLKAAKTTASNEIMTIINESVLGADIDAVRAEVKETMTHCGKSLYALRQQKENGDITLEEYEEMTSEVFDLHTSIMSRIGESKAVAAACYTACHANDKTNKDFYPWVLCFEGIVSILSHANQKGNILVPLPAHTSNDSIVEVFDGHLFVDYMGVSSCQAADGEYSVLNIMGKKYFEAKTNAKIIVESHKETKVYDDCLFTITGMKYAKDSKGNPFNAERVINALLKDCKVEVVYANNKYNVLIGGHVVGCAKTNANNSRVFSESLVGKELKITGVKGIKRALTKEDARGAKGQILNSLDLLAIPVGEATSVVNAEEATSYTPEYSDYNGYDVVNYEVADYEAEYIPASDWN